MSETDDPTEPRKPSRPRLRAVNPPDETAAPPTPLRAVTPHETAGAQRDAAGTLGDRPAEAASGTPRDATGTLADGPPNAASGTPRDAAGTLADGPPDAPSGTPRGSSAHAATPDLGEAMAPPAARGSRRGRSADAARRLRAAPLRLVPRIQLPPDDLPPGAA